MGERRERTVTMSRVLRDGARDDGSFDLAFWREAGAEAIFAAAWEMVGEVARIRVNMASNPDFRDLFSELCGAGAEFLVVGAHAVMFHTVPRYTKDLDVWVRPSPENAASLVDVENLERARSH